METSITYRNHLELKLQCDRANKTVFQHQYTTYPLRLSPIFRLEGASPNRAYCYLINTSPGLLAGDELNMSLRLTANTSLYLTDQAATKVHPMTAHAKATVNYQIVVDADASLELVPEPVILYANSVLEQNTLIKLHPTAKLFLSEIVLPGRLARQEYYNFNYYFNRLQVTDLAGKLLFIDATRLIGTQNPFKNNRLFTSKPIIGNAIAILPNTNLNLLTSQLEDIKSTICKNIEVATTILPSNNGIQIRTLAQKTIEIKKYFTYALNCIRAITDQLSLPYIAK